MKNPLTLAGIETATFRFVAQHLNHRTTAVPPTCVHLFIYLCNIYLLFIYVLFIYVLFIYILFIYLCVFSRPF